MRSENGSSEAAAGGTAVPVRERREPDARKELWLRRLSELLAKPGKNVLDLGCGTGSAAAFFVGRQHYVGVDLRAEHIAEARRFHPDGAFVEGDYTKLDLPERVLNAVIACDELRTSVDPSELESEVQRIAKWLRPGGFLLLHVDGRDANAFLKRRPRRAAESADQRREWSPRRLLGSGGLKAIDLEVVRRRPGGAPKGVWILARKPARPSRPRMTRTSIEKIVVNAIKKQRAPRAAPLAGALRNVRSSPIRLPRHRRPRAAEHRAPDRRRLGSTTEAVDLGRLCRAEEAGPAAVECSRDGTGAWIRSAGEAGGQIHLLGYPDDRVGAQVQAASELDIRAGFPPVRRLENVIFTPRFPDCLYDGSGQRVVETCRRRGPGLREVRSRAPGSIALPEHPNRFREPVLYWGAVARHWGVFHSEGIGRLWALRDGHMANLPILGPIAKFWNESTVNSFIAFFLTYVGVGIERILNLEEPTTFDEVFVPYPSFGIRGHAYTCHRELPEQVATAVGATPRDRTEQPVYFSRRYLPEHKRRVRNEERLETELRKKGVKIVAPERLSYEDQIRLVNSHLTFIGCIGSAFHSLLYALPGTQLRSIVIDSGTQHLSNYFMFDLIKELNATYVYVDPIDRREGMLIDGREAVSRLAELSVI